MVNSLLYESCNFIVTIWHANVNFMLSICFKLQKFSYIYNKAMCLKNLIRRYFLKLLLHWRWKEETIQHKCDNNKHHLQVATCPWNKIRASKVWAYAEGLKTTLPSQRLPFSLYFSCFIPCSFPNVSLYLGFYYT